MESFTRAGLHFDVTDVGPDLPGAPTVLCLHGFPQDRSAFDDVAHRLAGRGVRVLAPDQRGYSPGARPRGRRAYALTELVADAVALLDAAGAQRAHVVGHDWGGVVAWALAAWHPDRVASLTALSQAHPAAMDAAVRRSTQGLRSWYVAAFQVPLLPELVLSRPGALERLLVRSELPEHLARRYAERAVHGGVRDGRLAAGIGWYRALPLAGRPVGRVTVPVTYLHGWRDPFYAPASVLGTSDRVDGPFERRTLDTGHWVPEQEPGAVVEAVLDHVAAGASGGAEH
ncbi:alpha/beta fold hydrolase [Streptomyces sp. NP160]|uniref:alpha/beta fold hydrolase n=1 Tax=Streptomyces sp. NP160 TaxID=2586637 RepID=UPI0015D64E1C|nr:alpha/beta fold hydrolase [Streptomyces sp. NP160]